MSSQRFTVGADGVRPAGRGRGRILFGYTPIVDDQVPRCPCSSRTALLELPDDAKPLEGRLVCWCGATMAVTFDDVAERQAFVALHLGLEAAP